MPSEISPQLRWILAATLVGYVTVMYVVAWVAQNRIHDSQDYLVAGRKLPLSLAWMTLLATWFGAGTLLTATDEVRQHGVSAATLDPIGAGSCLLLAGLCVAAPMWRMKLLTVCDLFRERYDARTEFVAAVITIPAYFGWIAAQFHAVSGMLELFFGLAPQWGLPLVAMVGTGYTLMGGMWSVTLTDAVQIVLVLVGLIMLAGRVLLHLGQGSLGLGFWAIVEQSPAERLQLVPVETATAFLGWLSVFLVGSLGNLPAQDLMQRIFSSRSEVVARRACFLAGVMYLSFGMIPVGLGLSAAILFPDSSETAVLAVLAQEFLSPWWAVLFTLVVMSAVLSTIDSAILAPSSILSQNILVHRSSINPLLLNRLSVVGIGACSLVVAFLGEDAYSLLEDSYSLGLVGLFVPLMFGIYTIPRRPLPGLASILAGTLTWGVHFVFDWEYFLQGVSPVGQYYLPVALSSMIVSLLAYLLVEPPWRMQLARARDD